LLIFARFGEEADSFFEPPRARVVHSRRFQWLPGLIE